jgi:hypothetical protein
MQSSATLFDFVADDYLRFAELLFLPSLALVVVFLANARLKLSDFLKGTDLTYHPSPMLLGLVTVVAVLIVTTMMSIFITLRLYRTDPDLRQFEFYTRHIQGPSDVTSLKLQLHDYDGSSNLRVFLNGFTIFDTHMSCAMQHQCRKTQTSTSAYEQQLNYILNLKPRPYTAHCDKLEDLCPLLSDPRPLPLILSLIPPLDKKKVNEIWDESAIDEELPLYKVGDKPRLFQATEMEIQDLLVAGTNELAFIQENGKFNRCYSEWDVMFSIEGGKTIRKDVDIPTSGSFPGTYELCDRVYLLFKAR